MRRKQKSGGAAPYGYRRNEHGGFEPDGDEAPVRKLIFELFLQHKRKLTVAKELNKRGFRTRSGARFSDSSIDRFLRDPIVIGHHKDNFVLGSGEKQFAVLKPEAEWRYPPVEPIVEKSLWQQVQDILNGQKKKRIAKKPASLFAGFLYCDCGAKMHRPHGRRSYQCSRCDNSIEAKTLEAIFESKLDDFSVDRNLLVKIFGKNLDPENQKSQRQSQKKILLKRKAMLEDQLEKLFDQYISSSISKSTFDRSHIPLEAQLSEVYAALRVYEENSDFFDLEKFSKMGSMGKISSSLSHQMKRQVVEFYTQRIDVGATNIKITLLYPPS